MGRIYHKPVHVPKIKQKMVIVHIVLILVVYHSDEKDAPEKDKKKHRKLGTNGTYPHKSIGASK